jgi:hypothetical protein
LPYTESAVDHIDMEKIRERILAMLEDSYVWILKSGFHPNSDSDFCQPCFNRAEMMAHHHVRPRQQRGRSMKGIKDSLKYQGSQVHKKRILQGIGCRRFRSRWKHALISSTATCRSESDRTTCQFFSATNLSWGNNFLIAS